ncbi:SID1 transmembrane family member 1 [Orchesella cincta]|uniref:SID1 transmembrane family member 1 n=1 Tax=Orchesella cincta TaxID=48709 RepID=A0A1D2M3H9_ORCCI|nr:SID1 transmembrane family member 1 [Orchesella cincta]
MNRLTLFCPFRWNVTKSFDISHNTPHFFWFQFPEKSSFVRILADADSEKECPIFDEPESVNYEGIYQTISSSGALIVKKQDSFQEEFIVVLVVHPNNDKCMRWNPFSLPNDNLVQTRSNKDASSLKSTSLFVSILVKAEEELSPDKLPFPVLLNPQKRNALKGFTNGKEFIYVSGIVALFYVIPTVQFAAYYFRIGTSTGNLDICYYNFRCAQLIWYFVDFNHLFSNLPYMIFGLLFCLIVKVHESKLNGILELHQANNQIELSPIVPQTQDGFEKLMMISQLHFEDTCFMYVIAVLSTVLIYQQRHPRWFNSNHTFGTLGCMLFLNLCGLLLEAVLRLKIDPYICSHWELAFGCFSGVTLLVCFNYIFVGVLDERQRPVKRWKYFSARVRRTWNGILHSHRLLPYHFYFDNIDAWICVVLLSIDYF